MNQVILLIRLLFKINFIILYFKTFEYDITVGVNLFYANKSKLPESFYALYLYNIIHYLNILNLLSIDLNLINIYNICCSFIRSLILMIKITTKDKSFPLLDLFNIRNSNYLCIFILVYCFRWK